MCFDNIRMMRKSNEQMTDNDDLALGDQFDEILSVMITTLTETLATAESNMDKGKAVI